MYPQSSIKNLTIVDLVEIIGDIPQEENGLHVHLSKNKFKEIPISYPFRGNSYAILLVVKGSLKINYCVFFGPSPVKSHAHFLP